MSKTINTYFYEKTIESAKHLSFIKRKTTVIFRFFYQLYVIIIRLMSKIKTLEHASIQQGYCSHEVWSKRFYLKHNLDFLSENSTDIALTLPRINSQTISHITDSRL